MIKRLNLQIFADDGAASTATEAPGSASEKAETQAEAEKKATGEKKAEAKYTDADVDEILNKKFAKWQEQREKAVNEAKKLAEMNAQQKAEYERDKLQKELEAYKKKDALSEMTKTARKMLADANISVGDELLSMMVTTNADETKAAIDGFSKAFTEALENAMKERLRGESPRKGSAGGAAPMTKEQIMAIKDPELRQKKMLENKALFPNWR